MKLFNPEKANLTIKTQSSNTTIREKVEDEKNNSMLIKSFFDYKNQTQVDHTVKNILGKFKAIKSITIVAMIPATVAALFVNALNKFDVKLNAIHFHNIIGGTGHINSNLVNYLNAEIFSKIPPQTKYSFNLEMILGCATNKSYGTYCSIDALKDKVASADLDVARQLTI